MDEYLVLQNHIDVDYVPLSDYLDLASFRDYRDKLYKSCKNQYSNSNDNRLSYCLAAAISAGVCSALSNPLDCLRIRWQVAPQSDPAVSGGLYRYGLTIVKREGFFNGLWRPGLGPNVVGMSMSSAIRFGWYETVRDAIVELSDDKSGESENGNKKGMSQMLAAGLICGSIGYVSSTPFHLLKTISQTDKALNNEHFTRYISRATNDQTLKICSIERAKKIIQNNGLFGLWKGSTPLACRGALFTAGQMLGYDGFKTYCKEKGMEDGPYLHFVASIAASFGASFLSSPADLVMTKYMSSSDRNPQTVYSCVKGIVRENGIQGFWRGWPLFFIRLTPVMLTYSTIYEQCRLFLGIGYLS